jgi:hypothetical protein
VQFIFQKILERDVAQNVWQGKYCAKNSKYDYNGGID